MNKIKVMLVDDEPLALEILEPYLQQLSDVEHVVSCSNALEARDFLKTNELDVIFTDIQMNSDMMRPAIFRFEAPGMKTLENRVALVTGSTSGIGLAMARRVAMAGAEVVMNGYGEPGRNRLSTRGDRRIGQKPACISCRQTCSKGAEAQMLVKQTLALCGRIDVLINNAGIQHVSSIPDFPDDKWDAVIAINLSSAFHTSKIALADMQKRGWGRIINVASAHGLVASINISAYVASK